MTNRKLKALDLFCGGGGAAEKMRHSPITRQ